MTMATKPELEGRVRELETEVGLLRAHKCPQPVTWWPAPPGIALNAGCAPAHTFDVILNDSAALTVSAGVTGCAAPPLPTQYFTVRG
jgi:hypothetical protein